MQTTLITGASKGIGLATAIECAKRDGSHVIAVSRNAERLADFEEKCLRPGENKITTVPFDITKEESFTALGEALTEVEKIQALVNNAGLLIAKPFEDLTLADWRNMFEVNVFGVVRLTQMLLPWLKRAGGAHIVNIGSMGGFQGSSKFPGLSGYSASKAALSNLTECLSGELNAHHIRCNCLCLGAVNTEMLASAFPGYDAPVDSSEMGKFIADFSLNGHQFFNGQVLPVALNDPG